MRSIIAVAAMLLTVPAIAQETPAPAPEKKICRQGPPPTGSVMPGKRVCRTRTEWAQIDQATAGVVEKKRRESQRSLDSVKLGGS